MLAAIYGLNALRALESRADQAGIHLMLRAGQAIADWVAARYPTEARILLAAGPGNNGGDALMAARYLYQAGFHTDVLLPEPPKSMAALQALETLLTTGIRPLTALPPSYARPDLVVDGLFGIGIQRDFTPEWCARIERLNQLGAPILALDTPSGLDPYRGQAQNAAIHASATLTFLCHKPGLYTGDGADLAGKISLATLDHPGWAGSEPEGALNTPSVQGLARKNNSHKGSFGSVVIAGGATGMLGAALLAGRAALYAGAGKVFVCALDERVAVDPMAPELMIRGTDALPACTVLAIGPGLGQGQAAKHLLASALARTEPMVIDADALNLLAQDATLAGQLAQRSAPSILTPHPSEAARLLAATTAEVQADRLHAARALAERLNCVVVLKGAGSLIVCPDGYYHVNTSGGPALAAAGQGDVLTGLCAAMLAQGLDTFSAASLAVQVHGLVADGYVCEQGGPIGLTASLTAKRCAQIINQLLASVSAPRPRKPA